MRNTDSTPLRTRVLLSIGLLGSASLLLLGCSSGANSSTKTEDTDAAANRAPSGVSGEITSVSDGAIQVETNDGERSVSYTDDTTITEQVEASLSDVVAGVCITGMGAMGGENGSGSDSSSDSDSDAGTSSPALSSVSVSEAVDGACTGGMGAMGSGGGPGGPSGSDAPEDGAGGSDGGGDSEQGGSAPDGDAPTDAPSGEAPSGEAPSGGMGGFASGLVTAVDGQTITVESTADGESTSQQVTVDGETTYTLSQQATDDALQTGSCVVAQGENSDSDSESDEFPATSLTISAAGDDGCQSGMGGGPGGGAPGGSGDGSNENGSNDQSGGDEDGE